MDGKRTRCRLLKAACAFTEPILAKLKIGRMTFPQLLTFKHAPGWQASGGEELTSRAPAADHAQRVDAERRRRKPLPISPARHFGLPLLCGLSSTCTKDSHCWALTWRGLLACKPHVRGCREDRSSQLLPFVNHLELSPSLR